MKIINTTAYNTDDLQALVDACEKLRRSSTTVDVLVFAYRGAVRPTHHTFTKIVFLPRVSHLKIQPLIALAQAAEDDKSYLPDDYSLVLTNTICRYFGISVYKNQWPRTLKTSRKWRNLAKRKIRYSGRAAAGAAKRLEFVTAKIHEDEARQNLEYSVAHLMIAEEDIDLIQEDLKGAKAEFRQAKEQVCLSKKKLKACEAKTKKLMKELEK